MSQKLLEPSEQAENEGGQRVRAVSGFAEIQVCGYKETICEAPVDCRGRSADCQVIKGVDRTGH